MVVYVDNMYKYPIGRYRGMRMSHMIADTEAELHAMADKIGVSRRWYQGDHYDISYNKRQLAIIHGAVEITLRELSHKVIGQRRGRHAFKTAQDEFSQGVDGPKGPAGTPGTRARLGGPADSEGRQES